MPSESGFFRSGMCKGSCITAKRKRNKQALTIVGGLYAVVFWQDVPEKPEICLPKSSETFGAVNKMLPQKACRMMISI
jgi:hypothetical protein